MNPFATAAMAEGYARSRPALHGPIMELVRTALGLETYGSAAVDIGCGSGLSTRPLIGRAQRVIGIEPAFDMTACARAIAPAAQFVCGRGEEMPFPSESVDFMTAAGSLNFARPVQVLQEAHRVLAPQGVLVVYDFAQGRLFADSGALGEWYESFAARYPKPKGQAIPLDASKIAGLAEGFAMAASEEFQIPLPFDARAYGAYMMTETNAAAAVARGEDRDAIVAWIESTLPIVFGGRTRQVAFPGYWVALRRRSG